MEPLTFLQLLDYGRTYCSVAERCMAEVSEKLLARGALPNEVNDIIEKLKAGKYLSDERYALAYARSKLRYNKWGPKKIELELRRKGIDDALIQNALKALEPDDSHNILQKLCERKLETLKKLPAKEQKLKTIRYLTGKGYAYEMVSKILDEVIRGKT